MRAKTWTGGVAIAALAALVVAAVVARAGARTGAREIPIVARGMAFYLADDPSTANPSIQVRAGERVRVVVRNDTPGIAHDLAIPSLGLAVPPLSQGETGSAELVVPEQPGVYEYQCRPHALMMKGSLVVQ
jgi:plastocyanin